MVTKIYGFFCDRFFLGHPLSNSDILLFSKNDVILQSEGGGGRKRPKNAVIIMYGPLRQRCPSVS